MQLPKIHLNQTAPSNPNIVSARPYSSSSEPDLKTTLESIIPEKRELLKQVRSHADKKLGDVKVENALGGMRCDTPLRKVNRD